ncbi:MAG: 2-C-methyl-D-erythritol 2,4-cyclodiphosphate synthase [Dehalococcoidales bacterium]|nr:2-C-methyl-D-erythritol 2,4-cyclodiphosphate synthase [Dehalococcoidales bacterium]
MKGNCRAGIGYDVHALTAGRRLVLGGVEVTFERGLSGWSDADVLTHAIMDALLGAVALGDIGRHFPPGDPQYEGISSLKLLEKVKGLLDENGWQVSNVDATVIAERPSLSEHIKKMREKLCRTLGIEMEQVSVKASTSDGLGFTGRGEGIAALALATVKEKA